MIECTFAHVADIRRKGELRLWQHGIINWKQLLHQEQKDPHFTRRMWKMLRESCIECQQALENNDYYYFLQNFPDTLLWRLYPNLEHQILYVDVEMTGLHIDRDQITTIATFDGKTVHTFVRDENLNEFPSFLEQFPAICTFDGGKIDIPFIEREFKINLCHIHFDLFLLSRWLGISGGLKQIEKRLHFDRENLEGINGKSAIYFWEMYKETKDQRYLNTLLAYNVADVLFLPSILKIFTEKLRQKRNLPVKKMDLNQIATTLPSIPFETSLEVIEEGLQWLEEQSD